jgi:hypothetical protein
MTCAVGLATGVVLDVVHLGCARRSAAALPQFQNLCGLAIAPFVGGALFDALGVLKAPTRGRNATSLISMMHAVITSEHHFMAGVHTTRLLPLQPSPTRREGFSLALSEQSIGRGV